MVQNKVQDRVEIHGEPHNNVSTTRLNSLRAAVLGANDGIVSVAGIVAGVAGATTSRNTIVTAGIAGLVAGALSMAAGEYVSVSSQRDTERALLAQEKAELRDKPEEELEELAGIYRDKGLREKTAQAVAEELTEHDAFTAHATAELSIDPEDLNNPWHAAISSALSFIAGAAIPVLAVTIGPAASRLWVTFVAVLAALTLTGYLSARAGGADKLRAILRVVFGGAIAMIATYGIGVLVGTHI